MNSLSSNGSLRLNSGSSGGTQNMLQHQLTFAVEKMNLFIFGLDLIAVRDLEKLTFRVVKSLLKTMSKQ